MTWRALNPAQFQLPDALGVQKSVPLLPWVPQRLKALKPKDYSDCPATLGEHIKKRRKELGLKQQEAGERMGVGKETVANWEKGKTRPITTQFEPVLAFLGYDPMPAGRTLAERLEAKRRPLGATLDQVAAHLGWGPGTLAWYVNGPSRAIPPKRRALLDAFLDASAGRSSRSPRSGEAALTNGRDRSAQTTLEPSRGHGGQRSASQGSGASSEA